MLKFKSKSGSISAEPLMIILLAAILIFDSGISTLSILAAVLIHEAGHVAVMSAFGIGIKSVRISGLSVGIIRSEGTYGNRALIAVSSGGIAANMFCTLVCLILPECVRPFIYANISIAAANMVPMRGLDGGDIYEILRYRAKSKAVIVLIVVIRWMVTSAAFALSLLLLYRYKNPSMTAFIVYAVLSDGRR